MPPNVEVLAKASWARMTQNIGFREMDGDEVELRRAIMRSEGLPRKWARAFRPAKPATPITRGVRS